MKICSICGTEHTADQIRCSICGVLLPTVEVPEIRRKSSSFVEMKRCSHCGRLNKRTAVRCTNCGAYLEATEQYNLDTVSRSNAPIFLSVSSGEVIQIAHNMIIGREYQPEIWDAYAGRAAFRLQTDKNGAFTIENLKTHDCNVIKLNMPYHLGRKTFTFTRKEVLP